MNIRYQLLFIVVMFLSLSISAMAQDEIPDVEVFGGYSYLRAQDYDGDAGINLNGFAVSAAINFNDSLSWLTEGSHHRVTSDKTFLNGRFAGFEEDFKRTSIMAGMRYKASYETVQPFVHALAGGTLLTTSAKLNGQPIFADPITGRGGYNNINGISFVLGGGFDIKLNRRLAVRLVQADYIRTRYRGGLYENSFRASTGIVIRIGG